MVEQILAGGSVAITATIGLLTFLRGRRADNVLNVAGNIQTTFDATHQHIEELLEDIATQRQWLHACEETCRDLRKQLADRERTFREVEAQLANLKTLAFEQEQTIARHERTLNAVSRRSDHPPPERLSHREEDPDEPADP